MQEGIRINKYLSDAGVCSRREADRMLEAGRIRIGEHTAQPGDRVLLGNTVYLDETPVTVSQKKILLAYYKPRGIVCTTSKKEKDNIVDAIGYGQRIYPIGRLDKDSEGLILLTNQGELSDRILRGRNYHEKEYLVTVNRRITDAFLNQMRNGVPILDTVTRPCVVKRVDDCDFRIILTQGLNRQIRRMCEYLGYRVIKLKRVRIMNIELQDLKAGRYRKVEGEEWKQLKRMLEGKRDVCRRK